MEPKHAKFATEVDRLVRAAEEDTAEALCRLSLAQQAFDRAAEEMRLRLGQLPAAPAPPPEKPFLPQPGEDEESGEAAIPERFLQLFWLLLVASSMISFAAGFWMGRHAT